MRAALSDVAQAPLPGLPGAPSSGLSLGSVLESVANITGTYGATERAIERTGDALAAGNFTEVRLCGLKVTWQKPQLCQHSSWFPSQVVLLQLPVTMLCHSAGAQHAVPHRADACASARLPLQAVRAARGIDPDLSSLLSDLDLGDIADDLGLDLSGSLSLDLPSESVPSLPSPAIDFMEALQGNFSATVSDLPITAINLNGSSDASGQQWLFLMWTSVICLNRVLASAMKCRSFSKVCTVCPSVRATATP